MAPNHCNATLSFLDLFFKLLSTSHQVAPAKSLLSEQRTFSFLSTRAHPAPSLLPTTLSCMWTFSHRHRMASTSGSGPLEHGLSFCFRAWGHLKLFSHCRLGLRANGWQPGLPTDTDTEIPRESCVESGGWAVDEEGGTLLGRLSLMTIIVGRPRQAGEQRLGISQLSLQ